MSRALDAALALEMEGVVKILRARAMRGLANGTGQSQPYVLSCFWDDQPTGLRLAFTRDTGHHTSGWLKNPDYERCWHLSTSPLKEAERRIIHVAPERFGVGDSALGVGELAEPDKRVIALWVRAFYGDDVDKVWAESPKSEGGKARGVWHWRLFCDARWQPIVPRKEVYSRDFTPAGWRSATHVLAEGGWNVSQTEDGRIIESTVDPT